MASILPDFKLKLSENFTLLFSVLFLWKDDENQGVTLIPNCLSLLRNENCS